MYGDDLVWPEDDNRGRYRRPSDSDSADEGWPSGGGIFEKEVGMSKFDFYKWLLKLIDALASGDINKAKGLLDGEMNINSIDQLISAITMLENVPSSLKRDLGNLLSTAEKEIRNYDNGDPDALRRIMELGHKHIGFVDKLRKYLR